MREHLQQLADTIAAEEEAFPGCELRIVLDQSTNHTALAADALRSSSTDESSERVAPAVVPVFMSSFRPAPSPSEAF
jgi:hypothetical protein